jgi:hypothetical protein
MINFMYCLLVLMAVGSGVFLYISLSMYDNIDVKFSE